MYNFVIFGSDEDYHIISYNDINNVENAIYLYKNLYTENAVLNFLHRVHRTPNINKYLKLPFRNIWNGLYFKNNFINDNPICFIFFSGRYEMFKYGLLDYLKIKYPGSKYVCFYQDLVSKLIHLNINRVKERFDLVLSFDQADVEKYGLIYYPLIYSEYSCNIPNQVKDSDVYFVGKAKDRLSEIIDAFEYLDAEGLKCDFHIVGVKREEQAYKDKIDYCNQMPYIENISRIKSTRCILEIMQQGGHGYTLRVCEAIMYDKKLLSNNIELLNAPFYSKDCISIFKDSTKIDTEFIRNGNKNVSYNYKDKLSPKNLLDFITDKLNLA